MSAKPWPSNCVQIVCSKPEHFNYANLQGRRVDMHCADCDGEISLDSHSVTEARKQFPHAQYPDFPRLICTQCCLQYERPDVIHDLRKTVKRLASNENC